MLKLVAGEHVGQDGVQVAELWEGKRLIGVIYPTERGVKVVSKHIETTADLAAVFEASHGMIVIDPAPPPAILVNLLP